MAYLTILQRGFCGDSYSSYARTCLRIKAKSHQLFSGWLMLGWFYLGINEPERFGNYTLAIHSQELSAGV